MCKVLHLYSDLLNLYGEYGNAAILKNRLESAGLKKVEIIKHKFGEKIDLKGIDFIYCGSGTEKKLLKAAKDLLTYRDDFIEYNKNGGIALFTGNASELLGKSIKDFDGKTTECLTVFDYETEFVANTRFTGDVICECSLIPHSIIGFINKSSNTTASNTPFLSVKNQFCNFYIPETDGSVNNNFFGTHLIGPILIKNPPLLEYFVNVICENNGITPNPSEDDEAEKAYKNSLAELLGARKF